MQRSPCHECEMAAADKNGPGCLHCEKRCAYVASLEGRSGPVPMEMTDMAGRWKESEDQYLRDNPHLAAKQQAANLGRSAQSVSVRRSALKLTHQPRVMPTAPAVLKANTAPLSDLLWDLVNVREFEDLYERLKRSAKENFRTPELQALWFIHRGLAAEDSACDQRRHTDGSS